VQGDALRWSGRRVNCQPTWPSMPSTTWRRPGHAGLVDATTHSSTRRPRGEFELRLQGASYEEIARAGGGIRSTVVARARQRRGIVRQRRRTRRALMAEA